MRLLSGDIVHVFFEQVEINTGGCLQFFGNRSGPISRLADQIKSRTV
ncbi:MAG TPA: hypothetical protein VJ953_16245 [Saprospiraceae bacterium]|nr:hypothetical protein [Saprospiraceae bacterium]